jgi:predicted RNase H-like HicB family nuclease
VTTRTFYAVIRKGDESYVAQCPEVSTASQGRTIEEALADLREATELYLEEFPAPPDTAPVFLAFFEASLPPSHE